MTTDVQLESALQYGAAVIGWALLQGAWQTTLLWGAVRAWTLVTRPDAQRRHAAALTALGGSAVGVLLTTVAVHRAITADARRFAANAPSDARAMHYAGHDAGISLAAGLDALFDAMPWLIAVWIAGVCVCGVRALSAHRRLHASIRCGSTAPTYIVERVAMLARRMQLVHPPHVRVVGGHGPLVFSASRSWIVLPHVDFAPEELDAILLHELAHLRRRDPTVHHAVAILARLYWFHPAVHALVRTLNEAREECCDDLAVSSSVRPMTLARALVRLAADGHGMRDAFAAAGGALDTRIRRLLALEQRQPPSGAASPHRLARLRDAATTPTPACVVFAIVVAIGWVQGTLASTATVTAGRRLPVAAAIAGIVPTATMRIDAHDPAGPFVVELVNGRVAAVSIGGHPVAPQRVRVVGHQLRVHDAQRRLLLQASVSRDGRLEWNARERGVPIS